MPPSLHASVGAIGRDWVQRNPLPKGENINGVASNGTRLVAVGGYGTVLTSDDGSSWTPRASGVTAELLSIAWSGSQFLAVGANSTALFSADGVAWTSTPALDADTLRSVTWTGSRFVAVGSNALGGAAQSYDGTVWTRSTPGVDSLLQVASLSSASVYAITAKGVLAGQFGGGGLLAWSKVSITSGPTAADVPQSLEITGTNKFVLSTKNGSLVDLWNASNPTTWTKRTPSPTAPATPLRLGVAGSEVLGVADEGEVWTSANNGDSWTQVVAAEDANLLGGSKLGSTYVVVGQGGRIYSIAPPSELVWTSRYSTGEVDPLAGVAGAGTGFVAVGNGLSMTSADGTTWIDHPQVGLNMRSVAGDGSVHIAVGDGIWKSTDGGVIWSEMLAPTTAKTLSRVIWTGSQWVAVGVDAAASLVWTSPDGSLWTKATLPALSNKRMTGVGFTGGLLVVVGEGGLVLTSPDYGATWTKRTIVLKPGEHFTDTTFSNGLFVGVTSLGGVWTSANGNKWTNRLPASSGALTRVVWAGNQFIAVGDKGRELYSFGGLEWVKIDVGSSGNLKDLAWNGSKLAAVGESGMIRIGSGNQPTRPTLAFSTLSSTASEAAGTVNLTINLTPASPLPVSVLLTLGGTALPGVAKNSDYSLTSTTVVIPANTTSKIVAVQIKQDTLDEVDETAVFYLGTPKGDAVVGTPGFHTLTIQDDDQVPTFIVQPQDQLVQMGSPVTFTATVAASGVVTPPTPTLTALWKRPGLVTNAVPVASPAGATFNASLISAALINAGAYSVQVKNPSGSTTSASALLGVVDNTPKIINAAADGMAILMVKAAGGGLTYQWERNGTPLANSIDGRIVGTNTAKLTIKDLSAADTDTYACRVTQTTTSGSRNTLGGTTSLFVEVAVPAITSATLGSTTVGQPYNLTLSATGHPTKWLATGLPAGLTLNAATGQITGKANVAVTSGTDFTVNVSATNIIGTGPAKSLILHVDPLPAIAVSSYTGLVARSLALNGNLGGRLELTIAASGSFTGKLTQGKVATNFSGVVTYNPTGPLIQISLPLAPAGLPAVTLSLTIDPTLQTITGGTDNSPGVDTAVLTGWRSNLWTVSPPNLTAIPNREGTPYNFVINPANVPDPKGYGIGSFTIAADGAYTVTGTLADGQGFSTSGVMGTNGEIQIYTGLYKVVGSFEGTITVEEVPTVTGSPPNEVTDYIKNKTTGTLHWNKPDQGAEVDRTYHAGFSESVLNLTVNGGRYFAPPTPYVAPPPAAPTYQPKVYFGVTITAATGVGSNNAKFKFQSLGVDLPRPRSDDPDVVTISVSAPALLSAATSSIQHTINGPSGIFAGKATLQDANPLNVSETLIRTADFRGIVFRNTGTDTLLGRGYFLLPRLPEAGIPPTNLSTSPIQSGEVQFLKHP